MPRDKRFGFTISRHYVQKFLRSIDLYRTMMKMRCILQKFSHTRNERRAIKVLKVGFNLDKSQALLLSESHW